MEILNTRNKHTQSIDWYLNDFATDNNTFITYQITFNFAYKQQHWHKSYSQSIKKPCSILQDTREVI